MLEYDMLSGEFLEDPASAPEDIEHRDWRRASHLELRLLSVEEASRTHEAR